MTKFISIMPMASKKAKTMVKLNFIDVLLKKLLYCRLPADSEFDVSQYFDFYKYMIAAYKKKQ